MTFILLRYNYYFISISIIVGAPAHCKELPKLKYRHDLVRNILFIFLSVYVKRCTSEFIDSLTRREIDTLVGEYLLTRREIDTSVGEYFGA
jgi:hypothetical protein